MLSPIVPTEYQEHLSLMQWIRYRKDIEPYFIHIPNEGKRDPKTGNILKAMGLKKGVSDFFLAYPVYPYAGLWIELKRLEKSVISEEQQDWIDKMRRMHYQAHFAYGWEEAKAIIEGYLDNAP